MQFQFSENFNLWLQSYEYFQLDELPLTLLFLSLGLAWFAFRRITEISTLLSSNRDLTQRLISIQEKERRVLAQELHDEIGQTCTALRIEASFLGKAILSNHAAALEAIQRIDHSSLRMQNLARDMLKRLRPPNLDSLGFEASLRELCQNWQSNCRIECCALIDEIDYVLSDHLCTNIYRVIQEALTNIARHADATRVCVSLSVSSYILILTITDDGIGMQHNVSSHGLGLIGMRERIASLGGNINFDNAQPGLRINAKVPLPRDKT